MNHHHQEAEITEKDFLETIFIITGGRDENIRVSQRCFKLAQTYHKQQLSKALAEASRELPLNAEWESWFKGECNLRRDVNAQDWQSPNSLETFNWMRDKAAEVIAKKDEQFCHHDTVLRAMISEKDKLLADREEEIKTLRVIIDEARAVETET